MIHHTITFVAITTLHLVFLTFTMDIYRTDVAIWNQTQTTIDWQHHSSGTAYQQMAGKNSPESLNNMASANHNHLNESLENLVSAFNTASYTGTCNDLLYHIVSQKLQYTSCEWEFPQKLIRTAWVLYSKFNTLVKTALWFICTGNTVVGLGVIPWHGYTSTISQNLWSD